MKNTIDEKWRLNMKHDSSTKSWNHISKEWCEIAPVNETRQFFIMPYMLRLMGDVSGKKILDLGCGEGGYARELTRNGAEVVAVDCAEYSIEYAQKKSIEEGLNIKHLVRNSNNLCALEDASFDTILCSMMLMDCEDLEGTVKEISRLLKNDGKLYASVLHPCFTGKHIGREGKGINRKVIVEDYFNPQEYRQTLPGGTVEVIWRHCTFEEYVKIFVKNNLNIIDLNEGRPTEEEAKVSVPIAWLNKIPLFLFWELEKNN